MPVDAVGPIRTEDLTDLVRTFLEAAGAIPAEARLVADQLVDAEARESHAQGLIRLPPYVGWSRNGTIVSPTEVTVEQECGATLVLDAHNGWGQVAAMRAMDLCIERAQQTGICLAVVRNTNHIGRLGYYVEAAAEQGMIGLIAGSGNPASAWVAPWGGVKPLFGTNPIAFGFPRESAPPVVVDISTTQGARGRVLMAQRLGELLPEGWAFEASGDPTRDPAKALPPHGTLAPLGGHKGYALAVAIEILCGVLGGMWPPESSVNLVGAIRVEAFLPLDEYYRSLDALIEAIKSGPAAPGIEEILLPGEGSVTRKARTTAAGVSVPANLWSEITDLAREMGVHHRLVA
ncbi:MAG: Ldh family oxidoreductase [Thermomicrobiales bacterium]